MKIETVEILQTRIVIVPEATQTFTLAPDYGVFSGFRDQDLVQLPLFPFLSVPAEPACRPSGHWVVLSRIPRHPHLPRQPIATLQASVLAGGASRVEITLQFQNDAGHAHPSLRGIAPESAVVDPETLKNPRTTRRQYEQFSDTRSTAGGLFGERGEA